MSPEEKAEELAQHLYCHCGLDAAGRGYAAQVIGAALREFVAVERARLREALQILTDTPLLVFEAGTLVRLDNPEITEYVAKARAWIPRAQAFRAVNGK